MHLFTINWGPFMKKFLDVRVELHFFMKTQFLKTPIAIKLHSKTDVI